MRPRFVAAALSILLNVTLGVALGAAERDVRHVVLQAERPLGAEDRAELAAKGIVIQRATADGKYLARVAAGASDARVAAIEPIAADDKLHRSALREAASGRTWASINIYFHDDVAFDEARAAVLAAGGALDELFATKFEPMRKLRAKIAPHTLAALAADDRVLMISGPRRLQVKVDNAVSATVSHVKQVQAAPYGLTGAGVAVSLFELAEAQASHVEFGGRMTVFTTGGDNSLRQHATHVAGTIGAAGVFADAKGMAPAVTLYQYKVEEGPLGQPIYLNTKDEQLQLRGVVVDNNSWGYVLGWSGNIWLDNAEFFGAYDYELTAPIDEISIERNVLFVHSAGNEGEGVTLPPWGEHRHVNAAGQPISGEVFCYSKNGSGTDCPAGTCSAGPAHCEVAKHHPEVPFDTLGTPAAAKNAVTVGAVDSARFIWSESSRGPAKDGRIKPEVVTRGIGVFSTIPTNAYSTKNGTSMATPVVSGIAALLTEQWRRTFATTPKPAELKALLIAGAEDLGNPGPDYTFGFGLVNAKTSIDLIRNDAARGMHIRSASLADDQSAEFPLIVTEGENVRAVLQWADPAVFLPPSQIATASALVNDLDFRIVAPNGTTHLPYVLDKAVPNANAMRGVNTIDNTEMIEIASAPAGVYRVVVTGTDVVQGPQSAVLVTSARGPRPCVDAFEPHETNVNPSETLSAGICSPSDVDVFRFAASKDGPVSATVTAGDTRLRVTLTSSQVNGTIDVPAYATRTLAPGSVTATKTARVPVSVKIEATAPLGLEPDYTLTVAFSEATDRRRSVRK